MTSGLSVQSSNSGDSFTSHVNIILLHVTTWQPSQKYFAYQGKNISVSELKVVQNSQFYKILLTIKLPFTYISQLTTPSALASVSSPLRTLCPASTSLAPLSPTSVSWETFRLRGGRLSWLTSSPSSPPRPRASSLLRSARNWALMSICCLSGESLALSTSEPEPPGGEFWQFEGDVVRSVEPGLGEWAKLKQTNS